MTRALLLAALIASLALGSAVADNWPSGHNTSAPGMVLEDGAGNNIGATGSIPVTGTLVGGAPYAATDLGYCQLTTLTSSTGLASCSGGIPAGSTWVVAQAEAQTLRWRGDGSTTAPTATVGNQLLPAGQLILHVTDLTKVRFIQAASGGILNVEFFK